jgi:hypothetical protein
VGFISLLTIPNSGGTGQANVAYARAVSFSVSGINANLRVQNAVGVHTVSGWAGSVGTASGADRAYAVLNEDANTVIQTAGNINLIGTTKGITFGDGSFQATAASAFTGDLAGRDLVDSSNYRVMSTAYPVSIPSSTLNNNSYSSYVKNKPVYVLGVLQSPPAAASTVDGANIVLTSSQVVGFNQMANIQLATNSTGSGSRNTVGAHFLTTVTPAVTGMTNNDRVRAVTGQLDVNLDGKTWGTIGTQTGSQGATTLAGMNAMVNIMGSGSVGASLSGFFGTTVTPGSGGLANVSYATSMFGFLTASALGSSGATGQANVTYSRMVSGSVVGLSANLRVQNAVGIHTPSAWAGSVGTASGADRAYVLLNEDTTTELSTAGNILLPTSGKGIIFSNGSFQKAAGQVGSYANTALPTGSAGMMISVSTNGGRIAYWDTTNSRWSYVKDDTAV